MNKFIRLISTAIFSLLIISTNLSHLAFAQSSNPNISVSVKVFNGEITSEYSVEVPYNCGLDGKTFEGYTGICALNSLKEDGKITEFKTTYWPDYNAYTLDSLNGTANTSDWSKYWSIWYNTGMSSSIDSQKLTEGSKLDFYFGGYSEIYPFTTAQAEVHKVKVNIWDGPITSYNIDLGDKCTVNGKEFSGFKAICVLENLKQNGKISEYTTTYWLDYNAYTLDSINGITATLDWSKYWSIWLDKVSTSSIDSQIIPNNSELTYYFGGYSETYPSEVTVTPTVNPTPTSTPTTTPKPTSTKTDEATKFDLDKSIKFIINSQNPDGSIGKAYENDWAAIAIGSTQGNSDSKSKLISYFKNHTDVGSQTSSLARRSMALLSLGVNPYSGTDKNYIKQIISNLDKEGISKQSLNTLPFVGIVLAKSGYTEDDQIIKEIKSAILSKQSSNGSFKESFGDYTGPTLEFLAFLKRDSKVNSSIESAVEYLESSQKSDGGFDDLYTSGWDMNGLVAVGYTPKHIVYGNSGASLYEYFADLQLSNGKVGENETGIWGTTYVIVGIQNKSWGEIFTNFEKPTQNTPTVSPTITTTSTPIVSLTPKIKGESIEVMPPKETILPSLSEKQISEIKSDFTPTVTSYLKKSNENKSKSLPLFIQLIIYTSIIAASYGAYKYKYLIKKLVRLNEQKPNFFDKRLK